MDMFEVIAEGVADASGEVAYAWADRVPSLVEQYEALKAEFLGHSARCEAAGYFVAAGQARLEADRYGALAHDARMAEYRSL